MISYHSHNEEAPILSIRAIGLKINALLSNSLEQILIRLTDLFLEIRKAFSRIDGIGLDQSFLISVFAKLEKVSFFPIIPSKWAALYAPHAIYIDTINMKVFAAEIKNVLPELKIMTFFHELSIFIAAAQKFVKKATGIYDDGKVYWIDKGYVQICSISYASLKTGFPNFERYSDHIWRLNIEANECLLTLRQDSLRLARELTAFYSFLCQQDHVQAYDFDNKSYSSSRLSLVPSVSNIQIKSSDILENIFYIPAQHIYQYDVSQNNSVADAEASEQYFKSTMKGFNLIYPIFNTHRFLPDEWTQINANYNDSERFCEKEEVSVSKKDVPKFNICENYFYQNVNSCQKQETFTSGSQREFLVKLRLFFCDILVCVIIEEGSHFQSDALVFPLSSFASSKSKQLPSEISCYHSNISSENPQKETLKNMKRAVKVELRNVTGHFELSKLINVAESDYPIVFVSSIQISAFDVKVWDRAISKCQSSRWRLSLSKKSKSSSLPFSTVYLSSHTCGPEEDPIEYILKIKIIPLNLLIDQNVLEFLSETVFGRDPAASSLDDSIEKITIHENSWFFQKFHLSPISVRLSYRSRRINLPKIAIGRYGELLNLFSLKNASIELPSVNLSGFKGIKSIFEQVLKSWTSVVLMQIPKIVGELLPLRTIVRFSNSVANLILVPLRQFNDEGRALHGIQQSSLSFMQVTISESAAISRQVLGTGVWFLKHAQDFFHLKDIENSGNEFAIMSLNNLDTLTSLRIVGHEIIRDFESAAKTVIALPVKIVQTRQKEGSTESISTIFKVLPIVILKPLVNTASLLSIGLEALEKKYDE